MSLLLVLLLVSVTFEKANQALEQLGNSIHTVETYNKQDAYDALAGLQTLALLPPCPMAVPGFNSIVNSSQQALLEADAKLVGAKADKTNAEAELALSNYEDCISYCQAGELKCAEAATLYDSVGVAYLDAVLLIDSLCPPLGAP